MKSKILVISNKWDTHSDAVILSIEKLGGEVIRINTEDFRRNKIMFASDNDIWYITTPQKRQISQETIGGVYIRRTSMSIDVSNVNSLFQDFALQESRIFLDAIETMFEKKVWLNRFYNRKQASNKIRQLVLAKSVGLTIPPTLITNEETEARLFVSSSDVVIYKTLGCPIIQFKDNEQSMINTSIVQKDTEFDTVSIIPVLLQHYVEKKYELRIHIIGKKIFTVKIDSQNNEKAKIDWRIAQREICYKQISLPICVEQKLLNLMRLLKINFGIIDMIVTKGGEYVFLEVNPDGNWLWIEKKIHIPICEAIACYFLEKIGNGHDKYND